MANVIVRLIDSAYLKENTSVDPNVDADELLPFIDKSQRIIIEGALGTALYNDVCNAVSANTISADYLTLLQDYIQPCLAEWSVYNAMPNLWAKITNKSVSTSNSDNANPVTLDDMKFIREGMRDMAEYLEERLIKFLRANPNTYPLYLTPGSQTDTVYPKNNSLFSGIFVKKNRGCGGGNSYDFVYDSK